MITRINRDIFEQIRTRSFKNLSYVLQNFLEAVSLDYEFKCQNCCNKVLYFETSTLLIVEVFVPIQGFASELLSFVKCSSKHNS